MFYEYDSYKSSIKHRSNKYYSDTDSFVLTSDKKINSSKLFSQTEISEMIRSVSDIDSLIYNMTNIRAQHYNSFICSALSNRILNSVSQNRSTSQSEIHQDIDSVPSHTIPTTSNTLTNVNWRELHRYNDEKLMELIDSSYGNEFLNNVENSFQWELQHKTHSIKALVVDILRSKEDPQSIIALCKNIARFERFAKYCSLITSKGYKHRIDEIIHRNSHVLQILNSKDWLKQSITFYFENAEHETATIKNWIKSLIKKRYCDKTMKIVKQFSCDYETKYDNNLNRLYQSNIDLYRDNICFSKYGFTVFQITNLQYRRLFNEIIKKSMKTVGFKHIKGKSVVLIENKIRTKMYLLFMSEFMATVSISLPLMSAFRMYEREFGKSLIFKKNEYVIKISKLVDHLNDLLREIDLENEIFCNALDDTEQLRKFIPSGFNTIRNSNMIAYKQKEILFDLETYSVNIPESL